MISDYFDKIYIINMRRSLKRRMAALFHIQKLKLNNASLVEAVDGRSLDLEEMKVEGSLQWDDWKQRDLTQGEVGCYISHVKAWNMMVDQRLGNVLICEDDIVWRPDANEIADRFMSEVPDDWDIIHFHSYVGIGSGRHNDSDRKRISEHVWRGFDEGGGTLCYAINIRAARFLLGKAFPICYAVDGLTNKLTSPERNTEYHGYVCHPFLCGFSKIESEIDKIFKRVN
ncbi:MAG: glycosyltransferase family 25 protein [Deltaproteobacteria bacterium]|nr:glycosyltransferase family 25 protein [Deltaproteobacteria bacterium]